MTILTAMNITQDNRWKAPLYTGLATALVTLIMVLLIQVPVLSVLLGILIGAAPLVGYDLARGTFGANWRPVITGLIGNILFVVGLFLPAAFAWTVPVFILSILSMILWPIIVGALNQNQSIGKLLLASLGGLILGLIVVIAVIVPLFGQNAYSWPGIAVVIIWAVWGILVGTALRASPQ